MIKRYDIERLDYDYSDVTEQDGGDYVLFNDYESLRIENEINKAAAENGNRVAKEALERSLHPDKAIEAITKQLISHHKNILQEKEDTIISLKEEIKNLRIQLKNW